VSVYAEHIYQNGVPLLPESSATFGVRLNWTLSEFGKRTGKVRELQSQVAQARENLSLTQDRVNIDVEKQMRKVRRSISTLDAAQANVTARTEMRRIIADQVAAKTANASALTDAEFVLLGEDNGISQVPQFESAICTMMAWTLPKPRLRRQGADSALS